jgi:hypothetical protein
MRTRDSSAIHLPARVAHFNHSFDIHAPASVLSISASTGNIA